MTPLPIDALIPECLAKLEGGSLVVVAPPGSGKTTRLPPAIVGSSRLDPDHPNVVVLQPRRIAARAAARRVADERGWTLGDEVGYQVRFERRYSGSTRLRFVTEGILTRQLLADPFLETVGAVVLDEFHERNLETDLALALLREVRDEVRPDLLLVVMSATLDAEPVSRFLGGCPVVVAEGRTQPVAIEYRPVDRPANPETLAPIVQGWLDDPKESRHLLVFLPGMAEIRRAWKHLEPLAARADAIVLPLHGSLSPEEQDRALRPSQQRKIILSTNVAETSLTIEGVGTVIDSGQARIVRYDPSRGLDRWSLERISRASADQRAGRAGRTGPGRCIRLWSQRDERGMAPFEQPEIGRVDLSSTLLALHSWGQSDPLRFGWFEPPDSGRLAAAERQLIWLGALVGEPRRITPVGRRILELPVHPRLARLLLAAADSGRPAEGAAVAALLSEKDIRMRESSIATQRKDAGPSTTAASDILVRLDLLAEAESTRFSPSLRSRGIDPGAARHVAQLRDELIRRSGRGRGRRVDGGRSAAFAGGDDAILRWLLLAYPDRLVKRRGTEGTGLMVGGRGVRLASGSVVRDAELFLALDAREEQRDGRREVQVFLASAVAAEWLDELHPGSLHRERATVFDASRNRVVGVARLWYEDLLLREDLTSDLDRAEAGRVLAEEIGRRGSRPALENQRVVEWLARVELLSRSIPELKWPAFDEELLSEILAEACQGNTSLDEIERIDLLPFLEGRLDRQLARELRESAPETLMIPSGRRVRLVYEMGRAPMLAARVQELFGWSETPRVARGRVPVLLEILGPNLRPVQVTDDLHSFWTTTYFQVRKDLRGRYPKHPWPDDPLKASPVASTRRKST
jgi:ATP-dependent helicase HrpB